jgi:hypothetical protein
MQVGVDTHWHFSNSFYLVCLGLIYKFCIGGLSSNIVIINLFLEVNKWRILNSYHDI